jgi:hypothetical protein
MHSVLPEHGTRLCNYSTRRRTNFATFVSEIREKNVFDQKKYDLHYSCILQCHSLKVLGHTSWNGFLDSHPYSSDEDKAVHIFSSFPAHLVWVLNLLPSNITITVTLATFMTGFPTLSRTLFASYEIAAIQISYFNIRFVFCSYRGHQTCPCIPVTQCEQLIWFSSFKQGVTGGTDQTSRGCSLC